MKVLSLLLSLFISLSFNLTVVEKSFAADDIESEFDDFDKEEEEASSFPINGFVDARYGHRLKEVGHNKSFTLGEFRAQSEYQKTFKMVTIKFTGDLVYDAVNFEDDIDLDRGRGPLDLRELYFSFSPLSSLDMKVGRQALTWGTGDMIFINDLFPKDWNSFLMGRDLEYLKAPSDAVKFSQFNDFVNIDFVWTPVFDSDRYVTGNPVSYFSPAKGKIVGADGPIVPLERSSVGDESEYVLRLSKNLKGYEYALYGYQGFWKSPEGQNSKGEYYFPKLQVIGASMRGPLLGGIFNFEYGKYSSTEDHLGTNAYVRNSEQRILLGYEHEVVKNLTGSLQYYVEAMDNYGEYKANQPIGMGVKEESRQMLTVRLTHLSFNQNFTSSLFVFYSPTDKDGSVRPKVSYKATDKLRYELASNIFFGKEKSSFWGQFQENNNIYVALRYNY